MAIGPAASAPDVPGIDAPNVHWGDAVEPFVTSLVGAPPRSVAIVGGNLTGLSIALLLSEHGHRVAVLERGKHFGLAMAMPRRWTAVVDAALAAGFVINAPKPDVLRLAPPLIISAAELDSFIGALPSFIDQVVEEQL